MRSKMHLDCWMLILLQWVPHYILRIYLGRCSSPGCGLLCAAGPDKR